MGGNVLPTGGGVVYGGGTHDFVAHSWPKRRSVAPGMRPGAVGSFPYALAGATLLLRRKRLSGS